MVAMIESGRWDSKNLCLIHIDMHIEYLQFGVSKI